MIPDQIFAARELISAPAEKVSWRSKTSEPPNSLVTANFEPKNPGIEPTLSR
jgi:hypothetical protein